MSALLTIDAARAEDAPACARILSDWRRETAWMPLRQDPVRDRDFLADLIARGWVSVVRDGARLAGFMARDGGEIHALYVAASHRGQGVGHALLEQAKSAVPRLRLWTFQADARARAFYLREGFGELCRTDGAGNDDGLPDIRYEWSRA